MARYGTLTCSKWLEMALSGAVLVKMALSGAVLARYGTLTCVPMGLREHGSVWCRANSLWNLRPDGVP